MEQHTFQEIPGIPSPSKKDHTPYIEQIETAGALLKLERHIDLAAIHPVADFIIYMAFLVMDVKDWLFEFKEAQRKSLYVSLNRDAYWKAIAWRLSKPEVEALVMRLLPDLDREKYFSRPDIAPVTKKIVPETLPKERPRPSWNPNETIRQFITRCAPSSNYLQVFNFMSDHTKNRYSARGRKVYPYGQEYLARELDITTRTVRRIFSWLQRQHIIFKRSPHRYFKPGTSMWKNKTATWFICSSWRQSVWALDPKGQRPKKRPLRSPRKRHRRAVHTKPSPLKR